MSRYEENQPAPGQAMPAPIRPVILCGGAGTRLWPESRGERAKQFLPLAGDDSLFEQTLARVSTYDGFLQPLVVCGVPHVDAVRDGLGERQATILAEPAARNTAAAVAMAVAMAPDDELLLVMPSDHVIADVAAFHAAIARGVRLARGDWIVTFGITPDRPDTGFGYIARGEALGDESYVARRFIEKPPLADAEAMLAAGGYSWNAGIFLFRAGRMRDAMLLHCPDIYRAAADAAASGRQDGDALFADQALFETAPSNSIDYAVMEKDDRVALVPVAMGWSDLGSWQAVHALAPASDADGNAVRGDAFLHECRGTLVRTDGRRVSMIGVENMAVIVDGDDILVMPLDRAQDVRHAASARCR